ncbi:MAG: flavin reductase family protein [Planctomycetota bacterium]
MRFDPAEMSRDAFYFAMISVIIPRPIAWVSTLSAAGRPNLAPFSFFTGITSDPPSLLINVGTRGGAAKDTARNILETGQFVVNIVTDALAQQMVQTSGEYGPEVNEFETAGVTPLAAELVMPSRVQESPVSIECELMRCVDVDSVDVPGDISAHIILGRILLIHADESVLGDKGRVDPAKLDAIGRLGGTGYCRVRDIFQMQRPKV